MPHRDALSLRVPPYHEPAEKQKDFDLYLMDISYFSGKVEMLCVLACTRRTARSDSPK